MVLRCHMAAAGRLLLGLGLLVGSAVAACREPPGAGLTGDAGVTPQASAGSGGSPTVDGSLPDGAVGAEPTRRSITLIAGGDVSFGRSRGRLLIQDPGRDDFQTLRQLLSPADVRFVNLESPLSDQGGRTISPNNSLVFTGPPGGADALARAGIDIVSLANNHIWDFGESALRETLDNLDRVGVAYVGVGRDRSQAYGPRVIERGGFRVAFVAVTGIWNQGALATHPGKDFIADAADQDALVQAVAQARRESDAVVVSYHGGYEYADTPHEGTRRLLRAAVQAGADVVIGHHPHVTQRVELVDGKPIFYSLGNLLMRMVSGQPWTEFGLLARVVLSKRAPPQAEICPVRIFGLTPIPLAGDEKREVYERYFRARYGHLLNVGALVDRKTRVTMGPFAADGCAPLLAQPQ